MFVKHFGQHSCSPVKPRREREIAEAVKKYPAKGVSARKDILCSMLQEGKELSEVESKADQMLDRVILSKISATSKGNTDFSKLIELKERYKKDDPFLIYKLNHRDLSNQPTYVFKTSSVSVDIGKKLDRAGDHYLSSSYVHFDGNEKRVNNMTTLTLSIYHPLIRKQIILATLNCEGENKENAELFCRCWEEALGGKNESTCFNPTGIILDEKGSNWKTVENVYGKELLHRCYSCEFHFKQSVNRTLQDPTFNNGSSAKFQSLCKQMLESSNKANFKRSVQKLEDFLDEQPEHAKLKDWLNWWVLRKEHIFQHSKIHFLHILIWQK